MFYEKLSRRRWPDLLFRQLCERPSLPIDSTDTESPALSIVVPMKDESENVAPLIREIEKALGETLQYEIICIDDGSEDGTLSALKQAKADCPRLRVLKHEVCCGQSTATRTGVQAARADWVATLDGDLQNPPSEIAKLISARDQASATNLAMVAGQRLKREDSLFRKFCSRTANGFRSWALGDGIRDTGCSLKLFRRDVFLDLPYFDHMHRFLPALMQRTGGQVMTVDVEHRPRAAGQTKYGLMNRLWTGIIDLIGV
ncbi:MAG TPA: dolichol-phosphate mannosyltransferase, partial [Rhodospirillaceae bacterium]|nr:dolichol-phosphate mannosyltransferase [Rhodospirillaceae bacterium]